MTQNSSSDEEITNEINRFLRKLTETEENPIIVDAFLHTYNDDYNLKQLHRFLSPYDDMHKKAILRSYCYRHGQGENLYKAESLVLHYSIVKRIISNLVNAYEGSACSVDKTLVIMNALYKKLMGKETKDLDAEQWNVPLYPHVWLEVVDTLLLFLAGHERDYFHARKDLAEKYELI